MFCKNCGKEISEDDAFCSTCGMHTNTEKSIYNEPVECGVKIGFSDRINDPSLKRRMKKNRKGTLIFAIIMILLPITIAFFIGVSNDDFSSLPIGLAVSAVVFVCNFISLVKKKNEKQWDGVVVRKYTKEECHRDGEDHSVSKYTVYIVEVRDDTGKTRNIKEGSYTSSEHIYYDYLNVGDRIRYYPQFNYFYEKYDKTHDTQVNCPICGSFNPLTRDVCENCGVPIFK